MKRLIIRADASPQIGAGHIMRCLALAQTWQDGGGHVAFLSRCESAALRQRITGEGFELIPMQNSHPHREDLRNTLEYLEHSAVHAVSAAAAWVVLDGYHFGATYQKALKQAGARLLCIDDYGHAAHYSADLVLNQNISANEALYPSREPYTRLLLGTHYVMLRREFRSWQGWKRTIPEVARKLLVTMGGGDSDNVTLKVVEAIKGIGEPQLKIQITVGPENPNLDILESALLSAPCPMRLLKDVTDMPALMAWADIAVSAGGSTCWELAFMGLPTITIPVADNQRPIADILHKRGVVINLGWHESVTVGQIAETLASALYSRDERRRMSGAGRALVDGEGSNRICMLMEDRRLRLRLVYPEDCRQLWEWANDPEVRQASFSTAPIPWEEHLHWFAHKSCDPQCLHFIAVDDLDQPVGQVRFDIKEGEKAEIDVSIARGRRGKGYGKLILELATEELFRSTAVRAIDSFIKIDNIKSIKTFENSQYKCIGLLILYEQLAIHYLRERHIK